MLKAFINIYDGNFVGMLFPGIFALACYLVFYRSSRKWNFLAYLFIFMFLLRLAGRIYASRYSAGMIPLTVLFFTAFFYVLSKVEFIPKKIMNFLILAAAATAIVFAAVKSLRTDDKWDRFSNTVEAIKKLDGQRRGVVIDLTESQHRFKHYCRSDVISIDKSYHDLKNVLAGAILKYDIFFIYVKASQAEEMQKAFTGAWPELRLELVQSDKRNSLYSFRDTTKIRGEKLQSPPPARLEGKLDEDFENPAVFEVDKTPWMKLLKDRKIPSMSKDKVEFSHYLRHNPKAGFYAENAASGAVELVAGDLAIAGKKSFRCKTSDWAVFVYDRQLVRGKIYDCEVLYRGDAGNLFIVGAYVFGGSKMLEYRPLYIFGSSDKEVRRGRWRIDFAAFSKEADSCFLVFEFKKSEMILDNIKIIEED